ncbi:hypothetical protein CYLTODRAFT_360597 [Cylindrobasidium torrendii FP15055 ss-10]|uniref:PH domain-containing protein n=1 Tax=Cylindrobasidium torrendii FP15055 ss-10 TaxID=1314674 RepID=A0A0D7AYR7_9AGAR|nr:hypothetical protein CYLTODRAFT_360597 [Cylindrobasidium torrendii FP15055 ss-10]
MLAKSNTSVKPRAPSDQHHSTGIVTQQRIFIGDRQRFNMVEVGPSTNAGDVVEMIEAQGGFKGWVGTGNWMVWEVSQDFGMERPIRNFELISDVEAAWNKDKMVNIFVVKITPLASLLSRNNLPTSSPMHATYVEYEIKRGKWVKRWLKLKEHSLYIAKRDNGKDEQFLCSLSNFDAYYVTRISKAPKEFSFAIKSTEKMTLFENTDDYFHSFSCSKEKGEAWMENILTARSYVLHQERNILFKPASQAAASTKGASSLSRAPTRMRQPSAPLVNVQPNDVFAPGSLLQRS